MTNNAVNIQFGCGLCCPEKWINFDSSPTLKLQRLPVLGGAFQGNGLPQFPNDVKWGDITRGLPFKTGEADRVYCSHVLEHLCLADFRLGIAEVHRLLKPGGIFRLVVPDLEQLVNQYHESPKASRAATLMENSHLGVKQRNRSFRGFVREWLGGAKHLWMWDYEAAEAELESAGFKDIRRAQFGDSRDPYFALVEDVGRWDNALGVECKR